jgi:ribosomal protein L11 methyltransferase
LSRLIQLTFKASEEARTLLSDYLLGLGSEGVAEDVGDDGMYDFSAYFPIDEDLGAVIKSLKNYFSILKDSLPGIEIGDIEARQIHSSSWMVWRELLNMVRAGKRVVIVPPWVDYTAERNEIVIEINPSLAFGTGHHESTRLCLAGIEEIIERGSVGRMLDVGCGSGILSICAALLGVPDITGFDMDPVAIEESHKNSQNNLVGDKIKFFTGLIDSTSGSFDLIVANVYVEPILSMKEAFSEKLAPGGSLVVSGIPVSRAQEASEGLGTVGFNIFKERTEGDWVSFELCKD